jgi:transposase
MIALAAHQPIFLCTAATDMRKSFCGLSGIVRGQFGREPTDGSWFLFVNRKRDRLKILYWDRDGLALWYKRLESGTFEVLEARDGQAAIEIDATQLAMLLSGVSLESARRRKRFRKTA